MVNEKSGEIFKIPLSLSETGGVSTKRINDAVKEIQQWASEEFGYYIPDPNEQLDAFDDK